ncbi:unnamed protein product [[Actinomadura] parvosata subsp. kistnae]|uniref:Uncharacterized protein n=1 Tax=Nonomuraea composti TaxID=2720023 RepID=A0ABX1BE99_9ACTN|nr:MULTISPECIES: hypothetical protein [unclassified Nonomuraea]NJP94724.1 hypothetical protein [Nonomuraea sp. FMUSA5-5]SPM00059.1 unnamed protein product [Actinomadura parvosata subsp. kistnae]
MRFIVDLEYGTDGVHGLVTREGCDRSEPFHGWLELLSVLESPRSRGNPWDGP